MAFKLSVTSTQPSDCPYVAYVSTYIDSPRLDLSTVWPNISENDEDFGRGEWNKHVICFKLNQYDYFKLDLNA